ncbi:HAMP domain-containing sensor histidine kinase [Bordetella flabilis]
MSVRAAAIAMAVAILLCCLLAWRRRSAGFTTGAVILLLVSQALRWALLRGALAAWVAEADKANLSAAGLGLGACAVAWMVARGFRIRGLRLAAVLAGLVAWVLVAVSGAVAGPAAGFPAAGEALARLARLDAASLAPALAACATAVGALGTVLLLAMAALSRPDPLGRRAAARHRPAPPAESAALPAAWTAGQRQIETRLATLNEVMEQQRQMNALLAHEMRAPVATISAAVQSLEMVLEGSDEQVDSRLQRIGRAVARLTELMDQLLGQESIYDDAVAPQQASVDLSRLAADVVAAVQADIAHRLQLEAPAPAMAWCDGPLTGVVLRNLVHNAAKYSPADQPIVIQVGTLTARGERSAWIAVQDRGPGIEKEDQDRIFDPHFRRAAHRETKGLGLGLYLVRKICERQGGTLTVESEPGQGARFTITLPIAKVR